MSTTPTPVPTTPTTPTIFGISKTTLAGVLSFLITTLTILVAFQIPSALQTPQQSHTLLWATTAANLFLALCRAWVGLLQGDATTKVS